MIWKVGGVEIWLAHDGCGEFRTDRADLHLDVEGDHGCESGFGSVSFICKCEINEIEPS